MDDEVVVEALNYDRTVRRSWPARLVDRSDDVIVLIGVFDRMVSHPDLGVIRKGTSSKEYFYTQSCFNIFEFREPEGTFRNYYCNIALPPEFNGRTLRYIDLDIDVVVAADGEVTILDRDEFEANARRFDFPPSTVNAVEDALVELLQLIERRAEPFTSAGS
jgi:hypothetical protein